MKLKRTFRLPPDVVAQLAEFAMRRRVGQPDVVEAALRSFMSPDNPDQLEAAVNHRLDRIDRRLGQPIADQLPTLVLFGRRTIAMFARKGSPNVTVAVAVLAAAFGASGNATAQVSQPAKTTGFANSAKHIESLPEPLAEGDSE